MKTGFPCGAGNEAAEQKFLYCHLIFWYNHRMYNHVLEEISYEC